MRRRTSVILASLLVGLGALVVIVIGFSAGGGGLAERWVSETPRENHANHHPVGVGPDGTVIVAPVAEVPYTDAELTDTSCVLVRLSPGNGSVRWRAGVPAQRCFIHALTEPAIADIDRDGTLEAVVSSTENSLIAVNTTDGSEDWRVPLSTYGYGRPTVANITPAPGPEISTSDINGGVVVTTGTGDVQWRYDLGTTVWTRPVVWQAPIVGEFDGDDQRELLIGTNAGPVLLTTDGDLEWLQNGSAMDIAAGQIDDDPPLEFATAGVRTVRLYDDRAVEWERQFSKPNLKVIADANGDGEHAVYVGHLGGAVLALDAETGTTKWSTSISNNPDERVAAPVLGDVTGDGRREIVAVTESGTVSVLDAGSGSELAAYDRNVPIWTTPTLADIDRDSRDEILVRYGDGRVVALDYSG